MTYYTLACQHCSNPACVPVCPVEATYRRTEDGIVIQDNELCIGCKLCVEACPYQARTFYDEEPQWLLDFPVGDIDAPVHEKNFVTKCTFCVHRIDRGDRPACIDICPAQARFFGDMDDPDSDISKLLESREYTQLMTEMGTGPNVYLLT
jgi:molybdopterin-containing oxidoreductase family iron-sulfur binding subunit